MNNHQNAIFYPLDNFIKHSHSFAMTIFGVEALTVITASAPFIINAAPN
jgi:hypothetical protein